MKITYDNLELYESKSILIPGDSELAIELTDDESSITLAFKFIDSAENDKADVKSEMITDTKLLLTFINWSNPLGLSFPEPMRVGTLYKRQMYLLLNAKKSSPSTSVREILFSLFLGEGV